MKKLNDVVGVFYMGAVGLFAAVVAVGMIVEGSAKTATWAGGRIDAWKKRRAEKQSLKQEVATQRK